MSESWLGWFESMLASYEDNEPEPTIQCRPAPTDIQLEFQRDMAYCRDLCAEITKVLGAYASKKIPGLVQQDRGWTPQ